MKEAGGPSSSTPRGDAHGRARRDRDQHPVRAAIAPTRTRIIRRDPPATWNPGVRAPARSGTRPADRHATDSLAGLRRPGDAEWLGSVEISTGPAHCPTTSWCGCLRPGFFGGAVKSIDSDLGLADADTAPGRRPSTAPELRPGRGHRAGTRRRGWKELITHARASRTVDGDRMTGSVREVVGEIPSLSPGSRGAVRWCRRSSERSSASSESGRARRRGFDPHVAMGATLFLVPMEMGMGGAELYG